MYESRLLECSSCHNDRFLIEYTKRNIHAKCLDCNRIEILAWYHVKENLSSEGKISRLTKGNHKHWEGPLITRHEVLIKMKDD